jgi:hypothetical protein
MTDRTYGTYRTYRTQSYKSYVSCKSYPWRGRSAAPAVYPVHYRPLFRAPLMPPEPYRLLQADALQQWLQLPVIFRDLRMRVRIR